jgi:hypothetical protein
MKRNLGIHYNDETGSGGGSEEPKPPLDIPQLIESTTGGRFKTAEETTEFFANFDERYVPADKLKEYEGFIAPDKAYANSFTKEMNQLVANGASQDTIKLFVDLSMTNVDEVSDREAIVKRVAIEDGLPLSKAQLLVDNDFPSMEFFAEQKGYDLSDTDELNKAKREYALLEIKIEKEAKKSREFLAEKKKGVFDGVETNESKQEKAQAQIQELQKNWVGNRELSMTVDKLKTIEIKAEQKDFKYTYVHPVPEQEIKSMIENAEAYAVQNRITSSKENIDKIVDLLKNDYITRNFDNIISSIVVDVKSKALKGEIEEIEGDGKLKGNDEGEQKKENLSFYR